MNNVTIKQGFSFVEIMAIIAIIGVLTSIGLVAYGEVRKNARDGVRVSDLDQIRLAVTASFANDGLYPADESIVCTQGPGQCGVSIDDSEDTINWWVQRIVGRIADPKHGETGFSYHYDPALPCDSSGTVVAVWARTMESDTGPNAQAVLNNICNEPMTADPSLLNTNLTQDSYIKIVRYIEND